jgi:hypothetical protein
MNKELNLYRTISEGIDVDNKGRIWDIRINRNIKKEEMLNTITKVSDGSYSVEYNSPVTVFETDMYRIDLYDIDGIYLYSFPLNHFCDGIKINGDKVYITDKNRSMRFFIYNIIENKS